LWNGKLKPPADKSSIDSRHLYINHFDPLEGIPAIFNHSILDTTKGDTRRLGAILCNWPDRRVNNEEDVITMNAVYPSMIAFAERAWNGGGYHVYDANIGVPGSDRYEAFKGFEEKLLVHKRKYFSSLPFPYQQQSNVAWTMIGPFSNEGDVTRSFVPEQQGYLDTMQWENKLTLWGGTVWLRHFWHPIISSHLKQPNDSSTWYATRKIYADSAGYHPFWIGFNNISRSHKAPTPHAGTWDDKGSKLWVNGKEIAPPSWKFPGRIPKDLEDPLYDESYEYREPTKIYLQKGWNHVLLKMPVKSFRSPNEIPVKWMFTFVEMRERP
jgi:nitrogen fixation protein